MGAVAAQITSLRIVYSTVNADADQRKHLRSVSLAFVRGTHRGPVNSPHKWPVTRKMFPFDDVTMDLRNGVRGHPEIGPWLPPCAMQTHTSLRLWMLDTWWGPWPQVVIIARHIMVGPFRTFCGSPLCMRVLLLCLRPKSQCVFLFFRLFVSTFSLNWISITAIPLGIKQDEQLVGSK